MNPAGAPDAPPPAPSAEPPADGESWTVLRLVLWSAKWLEGKGVPAAQARLDAEHLLAHALGTSRLQLYLQFDRPLPSEERDRFRPLLLRRGAREPLQYVMGRAAFRELDLRVDPRVLIPRPETEELVQLVLDRVGGRAAGASALDVGTGSGAIALALAGEGGFGRVVATDPSGEALALARENAAEAGLEERVDFRRGAFFAPVGEGERFDVVVSNPPYVAEADRSGLQPEVRDHEPAGALFAGPAGLSVLERLVDEAPAHVAPGGLLALEVGLGQAQVVADRLREASAFREVRMERDLTRRPRFVVAEG